jgi:hypothetical protein
LAQIKQRFEALMVEAREVCAMLLRQTDFNMVAVANAWGGIDNRGKELQWKIDETWRSAVEPKFEEAGATPDLLRAQRMKGEALAYWLENERERTMVVIYVETATAIFESVKATRTDFKCSQCGGALAVPSAFRATNVPCSYCRAINVYEPGTALRNAEAMIAHPLCLSRSWNEWIGMRDAEKAWIAARPPTIAVLKAYERAQIAHYTAYHRAEEEFKPGSVKDLAEVVKTKMRSFYTLIDKEGVWVNAGRPRDIPL